MNDKAQLITALRDEFNRWEKMLTGLNEEAVTAPNRIESLSIKEILGHLTAWQEISVARMEAAQQNRDPDYPTWLRGVAPESEHDLDQINRWIYEMYQKRPWSEVHQEWRERFLHFLKRCDAIPENDLMKIGRYAWLNEYPLAAVLTGSQEHHQEHLEELLILLGQS